MLHVPFSRLAPLLRTYYAKSTSLEITFTYAPCCLFIFLAIFDFKFKHHDAPWSMSIIFFQVEAGTSWAIFKNPRVHFLVSIRMSFPAHKLKTVGASAVRKLRRKHSLSAFGKTTFWLRRLRLSWWFKRTCSYIILSIYLSVCLSIYLSIYLY